MYDIKESKDINTYFSSIYESIWWSFITTFTVGLSQDISPVTFEGKVFTSLLILFGFVLISLFTAMITDYFIDDEGINEKLDKLNSDIQELKELVRKK